jgi:uncharacterized protein YhaN
MDRLHELQHQYAQLQQKLDKLPVKDHPVFGTLSADEALEKARSDTDEYVNAGIVKREPVLICAMAVLLGLILLVTLPDIWYIGGLILLGGIGALGWLVMDLGKRRQLRETLYDAYDAPPEEWIPMAKEYAEDHDDARNKVKRQMRQLEDQIRVVCHGESVDELIRQCNTIIAKHDALSNAKRDYERALSNAEIVRAMATQMDKPDIADGLDYSAEETVRYLAEATEQLQQIQLKLGQAQGQSEALGDEDELKAQLKVVRQRIVKLEDIYAAASIALEALQEAKAELQRRFAPRISTRAQELFNQLTGTRYDRLILGDDLSLSAAAADEDTIRTSMWRSDGTVDQLYLALRLAVAGELTPEAPLILDDALVRFDDIRLAAAMEILRSEAKEKQVILFTCQSREATL